jgi:predicted RNase H-like HicB family nuclease
MNEITFEVERDESGWLIASWDAPDGKGGIATQGQDLRELQENVKEAVLCHFEEAAASRAIRAQIRRRHNLSLLPGERIRPVLRNGLIGIEGLENPT